MILLIEDNESITKALLYSLNQKGYDIVHKINVKDTLSFLEKEKVELIILDVL